MIAGGVVFLSGIAIWIATMNSTNLNGKGYVQNMRKAWLLMLLGAIIYLVESVL